MFAFEMSLEVAEEFYRRAAAAGAKTEEERTLILIEMAHEGLIKKVLHTKRTKAQYIEDLRKNFGVLDLTDLANDPHFDPEATLDAVWTVDSETGEEVLMDRKTNKELIRRKR